MSEPRARWRTAWWLMLGSVVVAACAFAAGWLDHREALTFSDSSHPVTGRVIESDCWVLCRGGPTVRVAYEKVDGSPAVGVLGGVERRYHVGEPVVVVYSSDTASAGEVFLPPAEPYLVGDARFSGLPGLPGLAALLVAFAAWAFPANLRRLDRRDAARADIGGSNHS